MAIISFANVMSNIIVLPFEKREDEDRRAMEVGSQPPRRPYTIDRRTLCCCTPQASGLSQTILSKPRTQAIYGEILGYDEFKLLCQTDDMSPMCTREEYILHMLLCTGKINQARRPASKRTSKLLSRPPARRKGGPSHGRHCYFERK